MAPKTKTNPYGMNDAQFKFCQVYLKQKDKNGTKAYREAYPDCKSEAAAAANACRLLMNDKVKAYLEEAAIKASEKAEITAARVLQEMGRVAFMDIRKLFNLDGTLKPIHELDDDTAAAVASVKVTELGGAKATEVKTWSKDQQLGNLAKHFALTPDTHNVNTDVEPTEAVRRILFALNLGKNQADTNVS